MNVLRKFSHFEPVETLSEHDPYVRVNLSRNIIDNKLYVCKVFKRSNPNFFLVEQEIRVQQSISHPNIVDIKEVIYMKESIIVIMEYYKNGDLLNTMEKRFISTTSKLRLFLQIVNAIEYLHRRGISHLDIKPENVFIDEKMNAKLADFGCCDDELTRKRPFYYRGTMVYSAPEMIMCNCYKTQLADIWSLGILFLTMMCGELPWKRIDNETIKKQVVQGVRLDFDNHPYYVNEVVSRCCELESEKRISVKDLKEYIVKLLKQKGVNAVRVSVSLKNPTCSVIQLKKENIYKMSVKSFTISQRKFRIQAISA